MPRSIYQATRRNSWPGSWCRSYTSFTHADLQVSGPSVTAGDKVSVTIDVTNSGSRDGEEVAQCYVHASNASVPMPVKQLRGFLRIALAKGETKKVSLELDIREFGHWDMDRRVL